VADLFWARVDRSDPDGCWLWLGARNWGGYGQAQAHRRPVLAHRLSVLLDGRDPTGGVVRHTCDVRHCVRPDHLIVGTQAENMRDVVERNRAALPHPVLSAAQRADLRRRYAQGMTQRAVGALFGISQASVSRYVNGFHDWFPDG
jgi:hypothetical protein